LPEYYGIFLASTWFGAFSQIIFILVSRVTFWAVDNPTSECDSIPATICRKLL